MKLTAVIVAYWPSRFPNIPQIVADLRGGSIVPDHIMVFNNNHRQELPKVEGASVVNAGWNYASRCKYAAAMLEPSDYYLLLDDDVSVMPDLVRHCASLASPGCCFSDLGGVMVNNYAHAARIVSGAKVDKPESVDVFLGMLQFVSWGAVVNMLSAEGTLRLGRLPDYRSVGDDYLISLANRPHTAVMPTFDNCNRKHIPTGPAAMQWDEGYYAIRDMFAFEAWRALGNAPFEGNRPQGRNVLDACAKYMQIVTARDNGTGPLENHS
jgi:hypothetical protein